MQQKNAAFRKRNQIQKANRTMFAWVAGASAIFGATLVVIIFFTQMLLFNEKVLSVKNETIKTLEKNNQNISELESQVRVLDTNQSLMDLRISPDDKAIQVVLDALPSDANSSALGSSLQSRLLIVPGVTLSSIKVDPVAGVEFLKGTSKVVSAKKTETKNRITFTFSVAGNQDGLKNVLTNLEKSIRTINVKSLTIKSQNMNTAMTVGGEAYYEPEKVVELIDKVVKQ